MKNWLLQSIVVLALVLSTNSARANDSSINGVGGRWQMMKSEHASVRMVSESVDLYLQPNGRYTTLAQFVFRNEGRAARVQMGFPESGGGDSSGDHRKTTSFQSFATWVDGQRITAQRRLTSADDEGFKALWVKTVSFAAGQTRRVKVRYVSGLGGTSMPHYRFANYDFTGGNWRGKVAQSVLTVHMNVPGTYWVSIAPMKTPPTFRRDGRCFIYTWNNWQAQDEFTFQYQVTLRGWLTTRKYTPVEISTAPGSNGSSQEFPINIDVPKQPLREKNVDVQVSGVFRGGQTFVSLREWLDWAQAQKRYATTYSEATGVISVRSGEKSVQFKNGARDGSFSVNRSGEDLLFVPISRLQALGAKFEVRPREHFIRFVS